MFARGSNQSVDCPAQWLLQSGILFKPHQHPAKTTTCNTICKTISNTVLRTVYVFPTAPAMLMGEQIGMTNWNLNKLIKKITSFLALKLARLISRCRPALKWAHRLCLFPPSVSLIYSNNFFVCGFIQLDASPEMVQHDFLMWLPLLQRLSHHHFLLTQMLFLTFADVKQR